LYDLEVPWYTSSDGDASEPEVFEPQAGYPWGYTQPCIAWYKDGEGEMTALVMIPGYRLFAIKDDKTGILIEDVNREKVFVAWGEYSEVFNHETKRDFFKYRNEELGENYKFNNWDYFLVATRDHNYRAPSQELLKVGYDDFKNLLDRYESTGKLDDETCTDEGNIKLSTPWIAFFKKPRKNHTVVKAFLGAPGYSIEKIVIENDKPGLYITDKNNDRTWVSWANWHVCLDYPSYAEWKAAKESGKTRKHSSPYAGVKKGFYKKSVGDNERKPFAATAFWDSRAIENHDEEDGNIMEKLPGVEPLKK